MTAVLGCHQTVEQSLPVEGAPVILISIDTLRADRLPAYGYRKIATPAIDRLANEGLLFKNAYAHVPLTLPSHATLFTGRLPYEIQVRSNIGFQLRAESGTTLPELLAKRGYATGGAVSAYVLRSETGLGRLFDVYDDAIEVWSAATLAALQRPGDDTVQAALDWIDRVNGQPFFLFLHLFEPHSPYEPIEPFRSRYSDPYDGEIATVDAILGHFFAELERRSLYDNALIVLTSDHGEGLGDHGEAEHGVLLYREVLHVPLMLKLPGSRDAGRHVRTPVQLVDLLPTLVQATGARPPKGLLGTSLFALADPSAVESMKERRIYSETLYPRLHLGWSQLRSLIDSKYHYIESPDPELFDFKTDPQERHNVRHERDRAFRTLAAQLVATPLNLEAPDKAEPEEMARLAALGYLGGTAGESEGPRLNPRDHVAVLQKVRHTFALNEQGRYRESVALCREILRDYPDLVDVYNQLAGNLRRLGRLEEALEAYREAIRRSPSLVDSLALEIGKLELDLGNLEAAELNALQAMKLSPLDASLLLGGIALERGDFAAAERAARAAIGPKKHPRVPALILLARVLVERGKLQPALETIEQAVIRVAEGAIPPVATLESTRGDILARLNQTSEAEAAFRAEIERFPTTTAAYVRLAILLASERRFSEIGPTLEAMVIASPFPRTFALAAQVMADLGNEEAAREYRRRGERLAADRTSQPTS